MIQLKEDTLQQTAPLLNGAVDPRLEMRQWRWGEERISPWKLKTLIWSLWEGYCCINLPFLFLLVRRKWQEEDAEQRFKCPKFPHFWPAHVAQHCGPPGLELFGLYSQKQLKHKCRVHNWFWNQFSVLFLVVGSRKCPSQVWCWVCGGKRRAQGLPRVSPQLPLSHSSCWRRKSSLSEKTQWFFLCVILQNSPNSPK